MDQLTSFLAEHNLYDNALTWTARIVGALAVFIIGRWVASWLSKKLSGLFRKRVDETLGGFLGNIIYAVLLAVIIIAALEQLGVQTTSFLAVLGAAGLAVGLAMKDSLSNFAAGVMLLLLRPFKSGDFVKAAGNMGTVMEIRVFHTMMKMLGGEELWIPNSSIMSSDIINYSAQPVRRVDLPIEVSYGDDLRKAREIIQKVIDADERVIEEPAPTIQVVELGESGVKFAVRPWTKTADWWPTTCDLLENIKIAFDDAGVTIPFPQRDVHVQGAEALQREAAE
jgi:small conductance mechanosensitive channel